MTLASNPGLYDPDPDWPDFAALFDVCSCARRDCERCAGWQLTPRTAAALWVAAGLTADDGYDDVADHGDAPVSDSPVGSGGGWALFDQYPPITHTQAAQWRRRAARACDDLAADLADGRWPRPRCPAEEMALHLILDRVLDWTAEPDAGLGVRPEELAGLPTHADDLDVEGARDALFADHEILLLFDPGSDGIEDPASEENRASRIGDYRPAAWFTPFTASDARNPDRGFRR